MSDIASALFQQMRLTILLTAKDGAEESPFHPAYLLAWDDGVYPILDESAEWHKPHAEQFRIPKEQVDRIFSLLCDHWDNEKEITFYGLEDMLGIHGTAYATEGIERHELVSICRYLFLHDKFDNEFWATLCRNHECPTEAHVIASGREVDIYFN